MFSSNEHMDAAIASALAMLRALGGSPTGAAAMELWHGVRDHANKRLVESAMQSIVEALPGVEEMRTCYDVVSEYGGKGWIDRDALAFKRADGSEVFLPHASQLDNGNFADGTSCYLEELGLSEEDYERAEAWVEEVRHERSALSIQEEGEEKQSFLFGLLAERLGLSREAITTLIDAGSVLSWMSHSAVWAMGPMANTNLRVAEPPYTGLHEEG